MRLAFWATTSSAIAVDMRSRPTLSPIMVRRSGLSVSQPKPLTSAPTARCQTCSVPSAAMAASTTDVAASRAIMAASISAPVEALDEGAEKGAEQAHRQQPQHGDHRDEERRIGLAVDDHAHHHRLEPAHDRVDEADRQQAPEVGGEAHEHQAGPRRATTVALR